MPVPPRSGGGGACPWLLLYPMPMSHAELTSIVQARVPQATCQRRSFTFFIQDHDQHFLHLSTMLTPEQATVAIDDWIMHLPHAL